MKEKNGYTRREFIKSGAATVLAGTLYLNLNPGLQAGEDQREPVVLIRRKELFDSKNRLDRDMVSDMLDEALAVLVNEKESSRAWKEIIRPDDKVGIKSNVWHHLPTPPELERAIKSGVEKAGVPSENISINDRGVRHDPIFKNATALINSRPMRTHDWSGLGTLLKNYIMFVPRPSAYHGDSCADLASIWKLPEIEGKTRLNILVMFTPLFHSVGPHGFNPEYTWAYNGLLVGFDPVAVDATGVRIIREKRKKYFKEERPINPPPKHIFLADTRHGLGTADPEKIKLIKLGWEEDILI